MDPENRAVSVSNADNIQTVSVSYDEGIFIQNVFHLLSCIDTILS